MFFLAPDDSEFHFDEDETAAAGEPEDSEEERAEPTSPGEGWIGCAVGICLAAPYAVINLSSYSHYENGTMSMPDVESFLYSDETGERIDTDRHHQEILSDAAFRKLEALRRQIAVILAKHRIQVLDKSVLDRRVPGLKAGPDTFLEEPLRVRDAFFFRGM